MKLMHQHFDKDITILKRNYIPFADGLGAVSIGSVELVVVDHWFWPRFAQGWEPDTQRIYQGAIKPGATVLDVGAWIGPTLLFALASGAEKIIAVEPNPDSFSMLQKIIELNPGIEQAITLVNLAVSSKPGVLKMGLSKGESDSSMFGMQNQGIEIQTTTLRQLIRDHNLDSMDLVKIDIEGAEALLTDDLIMLSRLRQQLVHLSIHVPFFPDGTDLTAFCDAFKDFDIYDDRGEVLTHAELIKRLLSKKTQPLWGTKHGNFFELLLMAR